jgi:hypothetical protein
MHLFGYLYEDYYNSYIKMRLKWWSAAARLLVLRGSNPAGGMDHCLL